MSSEHPSSNGLSCFVNCSVPKLRGRRARHVSMNEIVREEFQAIRWTLPINHLSRVKDPPVNNSTKAAANSVQQSDLIPRQLSGERVAETGHLVSRRRHRPVAPGRAGPHRFLRWPRQRGIVPHACSKLRSGTLTYSTGRSTLRLWQARRSGQKKLRSDCGGKWTRQN